MQNVEILSAVNIHIGRKRRNNEDNFYYNGTYLDKDKREIPISLFDKRSDSIQLYEVCDGMGGEEFGELASLIAVKTLEKYKVIFNTIKYHDFDKYIDMYLSEVNNLIYEKTKQFGGRRIGTTIALLCIENNNIHIYNIGDSRIYLLKNKKLEQLSEDHTQAIRFVKLGMMSKEEAKAHPHRNKLTQYLGIAPEEMIVKPHRSTRKLKNGDKYLLCSDGLIDMVSDNEIESILKQKKTEKEIADELINKALEKGGRDNITAIVITVKTKKKLFWFI